MGKTLVRIGQASNCNPTLRLYLPKRKARPTCGRAPLPARRTGKPVPLSALTGGSAVVTSRWRSSSSPKSPSWRSRASRSCAAQAARRRPSPTRAPISARQRPLPLDGRDDRRRLHQGRGPSRPHGPNVVCGGRQTAGRLRLPRPDGEGFGGGGRRRGGTGAQTAGVGGEGVDSDGRDWHFQL
jgi:hypothetical protein